MLQLTLCIDAFFEHLYNDIDMTSGVAPNHRLLLEFYCVYVVVVVFVFNVPPTAKVIWRWGHSLKSQPTDW